MNKLEKLMEAFRPIDAIVDLVRIGRKKANIGRRIADKIGPDPFYPTRLLYKKGKYHYSGDLAPKRIGKDINKAMAVTGLLGTGVGAAGYKLATRGKKNG